MTQQPQDQTSTANKPWHRYPLVWMMIAIPFSAVVMGVIMISLAVSTEDGLVADDYYKKGLEINRVINRERKALEMGLEADIGFDIADKIIHARFTRGTMASNPPVLHLYIQHATRANSDIAVTLNRGIDDKYIGQLPHALTPGAWYFEVSEQDWKLSKRAMVTEKDNFIELRSGH